MRTILAPGTVDGGDVCEADGHFLIGLSSCTNVEGARQLEAQVAERLERLGYRIRPLEMSEFRKMDGGLSCLSLRIPEGLHPGTG